MIWTWFFRSCNDVRMSFIKTRDGDDRTSCWAPFSACQNRER